MISGVTLLVILSGLGTIDLVFAEVYQVKILDGSSISGCEETDSCLSPSELTIEIGDSVSWVREEDVHHHIVSYTGSQLNWQTIDYGHTFQHLGTFHYSVSDMPWIQGIIIVEEILVSESYILKNDETGGDCYKIGNWKASSKTCTFNTDVSNAIVIRSNNLILDGNGHMIDGNYDERTDSPRTCILLDAKLGITIKNFEITNCLIGISLIDSLQNTIINNKIFDNTASGIHMQLSNDNVIRNNQILNNFESGMSFTGNNNLIENNIIKDNSYLYLGQTLKGWGIHFGGGESGANVITGNEIRGHAWGINTDGVQNYNIIKNNIIADNISGLRLNTAENFLIENNSIKNNEFGIQSYMYSGSGGKHTFRQNDISNNVKGIYLDSGRNILTENSITFNSEYGLLLLDVERQRSTHGNKIFNNNFIDNSRHVIHGSKNFFTVDGNGNYWDDFSLDCKDVDSDKICDGPYPFSSGTVGVVDNAVWTIQNGWIDQKSTPIIIESAPEPESTVEPENISESKLPEWVRNIFIWYAEDRISEEELLRAIQFLVQQGIIKI